MQKLIDENEIVIDRPKGTHHPKYPSLYYEWDYGHIKNTKSMDNSGIDLFRGSLTNKNIDTLIVAVDLYRNDSEIKLLIGCTEYEKKQILEFMNSTDSMKAIMVRKEIELSNINIKEMNGDYNYNELKEIYEDVIYNPTDEHIRQELRQYNGTTKKLYGLFTGEKLVGIIGIEEHGDFVEIVHLGTHPDYRSHGIGTKMLDYIKGLYQNMELTTDGDAVLFYKKYGFDVAEYQDPKYTEVTRYKCTYGSMSK
jgi:inorganic pyrophosphatase